MSWVNVGNVNHHYGVINVRHLDCLYSLQRISPIPGRVEKVLEILGGHGENQSGKWTSRFHHKVSDVGLMTCERRWLCFDCRQYLRQWRDWSDLWSICRAERKVPCLPLSNLPLFDLNWTPDIVRSSSGWPDPQFYHPMWYSISVSYIT